MFKKVFKLFWAWQDDKEEQWLQAMGEKGWALRHYNTGFYTFEKIKPTKYIYKLDYKTTRNSDMEEYVGIFEDSGWEHCAQYLGWHYFRTPAEGAKTPDIYSDTASKAHKYNSLATVLYLVLAMLVTLFITVLLRVDYESINIMRGIYVVLIGFTITGILRLKGKARKLSE
ncbi:DUF2812 domain-containing protein [Bacillus sp. HMF5848]|uniref:DUF2812 domain-containing protein n=1 Tax=Bacillus sp. HMF5848 TaxID=2495421 RepID=UPI000F76C3DF|nr:DUF2812 domain-containing protein [Bacillus sp. HMF5848]RSK28869.1 DUF2812 domain-containing protein [Bacillus sp. HMF5848]